MNAIKLAEVGDSLLKPLSGNWTRIRGINLQKVEETRAALMKLKAEGVRTCVLLRLESKDWKTKYLPEDLREAYEHGLTLGSAFGDLVDAWEVDNEPDLGFVPESAERYTAFLKATYLGLKAGNKQCEARSPTALVVMGALGLPPGPWLERFAANGGFAYTDGFNYHYYGYAEDFSAVYRQHEVAIMELSILNTQPSTAVTKSLPIFLTEVGYGLLGKQARDTKEGRLRQWRWFKSVGEQMATLRPEAPMAFYLPPYLEYDISEFGLTVSAEESAKNPDTRNLKPEDRIAGGIAYSPADFGAKGSEPWMKLIGTDIGGNQTTPALAWWFAGRRSGQTPGFQRETTAQAGPRGSASNNQSRSWEIVTAPPSPIVIDFLPGEGLSYLKRYNGSFVTSREPLASKRPETGDLKPDGPKSTTGDRPPVAAPSRSEELMIQVRTGNGNLYEAYPTRQAIHEWQRYLEAHSNFTMSFYGRAALPWRFKDNKPASLVIVMYPKRLPAIYEIRKPQLIRLSAVSFQPSTNYRYGRGTVVLYNFSDNPVTGRLVLPKTVGRITPNARGINELISLEPNERREVAVSIQVAADRSEHIEAPITFVSDDTSIPMARYLTALIPDIGGMKVSVMSALLPQHTAGNVDLGANNKLVASRPRASEETPMSEQAGWFAQSGAQIERTADGFIVTVTARSPSKPQRIEVEVPLPDDLDFPDDAFLALDFRLR